MKRREETEKLPVFSSTERYRDFFGLLAIEIYPGRPGPAARVAQAQKDVAKAAKRGGRCSFDSIEQCPASRRRSTEIGARPLRRTRARAAAAHGRWCAPGELEPRAREPAPCDWTSPGLTVKHQTTPRCPDRKVAMIDQQAQPAVRLHAHRH